MIAAVLYQLNHPDGIVRASSLAFDWTDPEGRTWIGSAGLIQHGPRGPSASADGGSIFITWSGASEELLALALDGRLTRNEIWIANVLIDPETLARVGLPFAAWAGYVETPEIVADPAAPAITVAAQSFLIDLGTARPVRLSPEAQREISPGDTGADFVAGLSDGTARVR